MTAKSVKVNRAPVMVLWGAVVAKRLGFNEDEALSLGQAVSVLNARSKARRLGIIAEESPAEAHARKAYTEPEKRVEILGRLIPVRQINGRLRATLGEETVESAQVERYLRSKFGPKYDDVRAVMDDLAASYSPDELRDIAYTLYERFRPAVTSGQQGWGQKGELDLSKIESLKRD